VYGVYDKHCNMDNNVHGNERVFGHFMFLLLWTMTDANDDDDDYDRPRGGVL
jgi:hypothetical protein